MEAQAKYYNQKHKAKQYSRGDLVMLSTPNLNLKLPSKKMRPKFIGPLRVLAPVGSQAYRLALPEQYAQIHNVFHVSLLEPYVARPGGQADELQMPDLEDNPDQWEVEEVVGDSVRDGDQYYLVKWAIWSVEYNQWVPVEDMGNAQEAVAACLKKKGKPRGKRSAEAKGRKKA